MCVRERFVDSVCMCGVFVDGGCSLPWRSCLVIQEQADGEKVVKMNETAHSGVNFITRLHVPGVEQQNTQ